MKIRIGTGFLGWPFPTREARYLWEFVDVCEAQGIDSIWMSDRVVSPGMTLESMSVLAAMAGRTKRMKFGNSVLALPLRNPTVLAKEIATIDFISGGRMLPAVGIGTDSPAEFEACGVPFKERAGRTDEMLVLMRRLWTEEKVTHRGKYYQTTEVTLSPRPAQKPCPPIWIGGRTEAAFRRVGRLGDGWLPSSMTPAEVGEGIASIRRHAAESGRSVPEDHYGAIIGYCFGASKAEALKAGAQYAFRTRPELRPEEIGAFGTAEDIATAIESFVAQGSSKFVMRACCAPEETLGQTERLAREIVPLFHKR